MDPKACLDRAFRAFGREDHEEAREALADYWQWRRRGGFEPRWPSRTSGRPVRGDMEADRLGNRLRGTL